ncbi:MAG: hypothetical protein H6719_07490 [Sandaracinaceae bacterium]|nr:hypothetical protein [Sandaracinaceae bacterium]
MLRHLFVAALALTSGACALGGARPGDAGTDAGPSEAGPLGLDAGAGGFDAGPLGFDAGPLGFDAGPLGFDAGPSGFDAGPLGFDAGPLGFDAGPAGFDAGPPGSDAGALSSELSLPDPSGTPCTSPGSLGECPGIEVCRFFTPAEGRCETCGPCGNLNAPCAASSECDILFMCFRGRCTNFCTLGTFECGAITDCVDIGHPTRGVCR